MHSSFNEWTVQISMAKSRNAKKTEKKKPTKTLIEKRKAKKAKRESK
jgi:hypothetical protein